MVLLRGENGGYGKQLVGERCCERASRLLGPSIGERVYTATLNGRQRLATTIDHAVSVVKTETIVGHVRGNGKEDVR